MKVVFCIYNLCGCLPGIRSSCIRSEIKDNILAKYKTLLCYLFISLFKGKKSVVHVACFILRDFLKLPVVVVSLLSWTISLCNRERIIISYLYTELPEQHLYRNLSGQKNVLAKTEGKLNGRSEKKEKVQTKIIWR